MKRFLLCALALAAVSCTNEQLDRLGITDPAARATLLALPDEPDEGRGIAEGDGTYDASKCGVVPTEYRIYDPGPAMRAFYAVTCRRGWAKADILAWDDFAEGVMRRESGFCPGLFRGDRPDEKCQVHRHTGNQDAGFAQVVIRNFPWMCAQEGICDRWGIIATPTSSMTAFVAVIEHSGSSPWCWTAKLRRGAVCQSAP